MDEDKRPDQAPETRAPNDLPEAQDPTTERIHKLSNFNVSDALGLPLLTNDAAAPRRETGAEGRVFGGAGETRGGVSLFGDWGAQTGAGLLNQFDRRDRLAIAAFAAMILGPLFFGAFR